MIKAYWTVRWRIIRHTHMWTNTPFRRMTKLAAAKDTKATLRLMYEMRYALRSVLSILRKEVVRARVDRCPQLIKHLNIWHKISMPWCVQGSM